MVVATRPVIVAVARSVGVEVGVTVVSIIVDCAIIADNNAATQTIHWYRIPSCTPAKLIAASQTATYTWGGLAIATGAAMKPDKCYAYFLSYLFDGSRAKLRTIKALPDLIAPITLSTSEIASLHLQVPLPDGTTAPIPTLRNKDASLLLGIYLGPTSRGEPHIREMVRKGYTWADRLKS